MCVCVCVCVCPPSLCRSTSLSHKFLVYIHDTYIHCYNRLQFFAFSHWGVHTNVLELCAFAICTPPPLPTSADQSNQLAMRTFLGCCFKHILNLTCFSIDCSFLVLELEVLHLLQRLSVWRAFTMWFFSFQKRNKNQVWQDIVLGGGWSWQEESQSKKQVKWLTSSLQSSC